MKKKTMKAILALLLLTMLTAMAIAADEPYGPTAVTRESDQRGNVSFGTSAQQVQAQAGNVTQLTINTTQITKRWQGYYGNITGKITLDDGSSNTMYDWVVTNGGFTPVGEIYAANQSVTSWSDIICVDFTGDGVPGQKGINISVLETMYGMSASDVDGVDETFSNIGDIVIGTTTLTGCPATYIYQSDSQAAGTWNETLLTENSTATVIFAAQVEQNTIGFDGNAWDFQMIVGENGDNSDTTPYYFYVELA